MATTISNDLHGVDYSDVFEYSRKPNGFNYTLRASGGGKVSFKAEYYQPALIGETGTSGQWYTMEEKSQVTSGTTSSGSFTVPEVKLSSSVTAEKTTIRLTFSRALLSEGVDYEFYMQHT